MKRFIRPLIQPLSWLRAAFSWLFAHMAQNLVAFAMGAFLLWLAFYYTVLLFVAPHEVWETLKWAHQNKLSSGLLIFAAWLALVVQPDEGYDYDGDDRSVSSQDYGPTREDREREDANVWYDMKNQ
jgi:hypothetical protein